MPVQPPHKIEKRDGRIVPFEKEKIANAIGKAAQAAAGESRERADFIADKVIETLTAQFGPEGIPHVEEIQDLVEKTLIDYGHAETAKAYILYREKRSEERRQRSLLGIEDGLKLPLNSLTVLRQRYLRRDERRQIIETPRELFERVAKSVAGPDREFHDFDVLQSTRDFFKVMTRLWFLPNSPTLMNAGTSIQQLSACFVLPIEDVMESIFDSIKYTALIHKSGGGTGFSFSKLRPKGDVVQTTGGIASGPISFMEVFNAATNVIKQGGKRRGANMGILRVDHPDIMEFITCKDNEQALTNFNISVGITDAFMKAVEKGADYSLINPRDGKPVREIEARSVFNLITMMAWKNGEPGIVFLDRINQENPTPEVGQIEATNPCGEQPLLPWESCNLGSINLAKMLRDGEIDWGRLEFVARTSVHFLDNVITANKYPLGKIEEMTKANRKIGLGVMGFADMLLNLNIPYNSQEALALSEKVMGFIQKTARETSVQLGTSRGSFPNFEKSIWAKKYPAMRNATVTTIAPTGTIGIIAGASSGVEPLFAISFTRRHVLEEGSELVELNPIFEARAQREGFYNEDTMRLVARHGSIQKITEIPEAVRRVFVTALDITPEDHIRMQAAFQKYTDNAVSKTVNFPRSATVDDVSEVYRLAYKLGCKGVTIYRDQSREEQVLNIEEASFNGNSNGNGNHNGSQHLTKCPECGAEIQNGEGCQTCPSCGYSACSVTH